MGNDRDRHSSRSRDRTSSGRHYREDYSSSYKSNRHDDGRRTRNGKDSSSGRTHDRGAINSEEDTDNDSEGGESDAVASRGGSARSGRTAGQSGSSRQGGAVATPSQEISLHQQQYLQVQNQVQWNQQPPSSFPQATAPSFNPYPSQGSNFVGPNGQLCKLIFIVMGKLSLTCVLLIRFANYHNDSISAVSAEPFRKPILFFDERSVSTSTTSAFRSKRIAAEVPTAPASPDLLHSSIIFAGPFSRACASRLVSFPFSSSASISILARRILSSGRVSVHPTSELHYSSNQFASVPCASADRATTFSCRASARSSER